MSLFDDDNAEIKKAINYFNLLSDSEKMAIVTELYLNTSKLKHHYDNLVPLLSQIQSDMVKHDDLKIGNKLLEFGLDKTYARLFAFNVKNQLPTEEYQLSQIKKIDDETFASILAHMAHDIRIDQNDLYNIVEKTGISSEELGCAMDFIRKLKMDLTRHEITPNLIEKKYTEKLSYKKLDVLTGWAMNNH